MDYRYNPTVRVHFIRKALDLPVHSSYIILKEKQVPLPTHGHLLPHVHRFLF